MVNCTELIERFVASIGSGVNCRLEDNGFFSVATPFVTIDGDCIEFFVKEIEDGQIQITDFGESSRFLANYGIDLMESSVRAEYIDQIRSSCGVTIDGGRISKRVPIDDVGDGMLQVFEACKFICDMVYTGRPREESDFRDRVRTAIMEKVRRVSQGERTVLIGKSGKKWNSDFYAEGSGVGGAWIELVAGMHKSTVDNRVVKAFAMFSDVLPSVKRLTVIDDTSGLVADGDVTFISQVSPVALWSKRAELITKIGEIVNAR